MKSYHFTSPKIVGLLIVYRIFMLAFLEVMLVIFRNDMTFYLQIAAVFLVVLEFMIAYAKNRNAFVIFKINEIGLHSKYLSVRWVDISSYTLLESTTYVMNDPNPWYKIKAPSVVCIGNYDEGKSFFKQNRHECLFFSLTQKQLIAVNKFGKGKSEAVDQILEYYYIANDNSM